jgi:type 1 glutamine amidotransferase
MRTSKSICTILLMVLCTAMVASVSKAGETPLKALIVNGQTNMWHDWQVSSPIIKQILEQTGLFNVDVATSPPRGGNMEDFKPDFSGYDVVILDYDGEDWSEQTKTAFVEYVKNGGGVVVFHSSDNAFPKWVEFNEIIGLGGWGGRNEKAGPYVHWREGKIVLDTKPGIAGSHPPAHDYQVIIRNKDHPITKGLPEKWMHAHDELYGKLRGPAKNLTVLATAYSDPNLTDGKPEGTGTGEHEPVLFTINYDKGRVFHTTFGHAKRPPVPSMECVGFITTFQRGAEWAATGKVTQKVPDDFPTETEVRRWKNYKNPKTNVSSEKGP